MQTKKHEAFARIHEITNSRTQVELANALGVRQSSISDAKRRGEIPANWLLTLLMRYGINPEWIRTGLGSRYMIATDEPDKTLLASLAEDIKAEIAANVRREIEMEYDPYRLMKILQAQMPTAHIHIDMPAATRTAPLNTRTAQ